MSHKKSRRLTQRSPKRAISGWKLNMLVGTEDGDTYTEAEVKSWLKKSGFTGIRRLEGEGPASMIIAKKKK